MRKRFISQTPQDPQAEPAHGPLIAPDEITHRYFANAVADIRSAIAIARSTAETDADGALAAALERGPTTAPSWAPELPPMAATEPTSVSEVTQRYADRSVAGIRAAIAAAREAEAQASPTRAAARFALGDSSQPKIPSMVVTPADHTAAAPADDAPADDAPEVP